MHEHTLPILHNQPSLTNRVILDSIGNIFYLYYSNMMVESFLARAL